MAAEIARGEPRGSVHQVSAAQQRADRIRKNVASAAQEYAQAVLDRDWHVLGYDSVADWAADQFGAHRFTVETRRQVAEILSAGGQTVREIAQATGVSKSVAGEDVALVRKPDKAADQPGCNETAENVTLPKAPKTSARRVREHRERKKTGQAARQQVKDDVTITDPQPCPRCAPHIADLEAQLEKARKQLEKKDERIEHLEKVRPDAQVLAEQNAELTEKNAELQAKLSAALIAAGQSSPGIDPQPRPEVPDGDVCAGCKGPGARRAWAVRPDGTKRSNDLCDGCLARFAAQHPGWICSRTEPPDPPSVTSQAEIDAIFASFSID